MALRCRLQQRYAETFRIFSKNLKAPMFYRGRGRGRIALASGTFGSHATHRPFVDAEHANLENPSVF